MVLLVKRKYFAFAALLAALWLASSVNIIGMYAGEAVATLAPVRCGLTGNPCASLMFNVDWGEEYIPGILDILRANNVKVTFFPTGTWAERNADLAKRIALEGHELGNHGGSHVHVETMSREKLHAVIRSGEQRIFDATGFRPSPLFAPPSGEWTGDTVSYAMELGYQTILWTVDTVDWRHPPPETIWKRALAGATPGSLVLMHPTENTLAALPEIIQGFKDKGLMLVTVSENIVKRPEP